MISVLIPVFNYDISYLVSCLHQGIGESEILLEIVIGADGCDHSHITSYKALERLKGVRVVVSEENIGRAAIRNRLADAAKGDYLLFIDADAMLDGNVAPFINRYAENLHKAPVICGGTSYRSVPPDDPDRFLRWNYGIHREQRSAKKRNKNPYSSFSGFNFLVEKNVFIKLRFNEALRKYGHEDTLFGYQLRKASIRIVHINNPLVHGGIETNREFIIKTQEGIQNLSILYDKVTDKRTFTKSVRLLKLYRMLKIFGITFIISLFYTRHRRKIEIFLRRRRSTLLIFSIYKLALFSYCRNSKSVI